MVLAHRVRDGRRDVEADDVGEQCVLAAQMQLFAEGEHDGHQQHGLVTGGEIVEILRVTERPVRHRGIHRVGLDPGSHHAGHGLTAEFLDQTRHDLAERSRRQMAPTASSRHSFARFTAGVGISSNFAPEMK
jgi:hypothetical protein